MRCPIDETWLGAGTSTCPDCGVDAGPLRALALVAAKALADAALADTASARDLVAVASDLMPASEAFLADAARALKAAGDTVGAVERYRQALAIAPGRTDLAAELRALDGSWATSPRPHTTSTSAAATPLVTQPDLGSDWRPRHAAARARRDRAELGSAEYIVAAEEVARIEIEAAASLSG